MRVVPGIVVLGALSFVDAVPLAAQEAAPTTGIVETLVGPINAGTGGIEVYPDGVIYVADFGAHLSKGPIGTRVWRVTPDGVLSVFAEGLVGASGNALDEHGNLLQANIAGGTISVIHPDGTVEPYAAGEFRAPVGVAISPAGDVYVANCGSNSIAVITADGVGEIFVSDSLLACPNGIAFAPNGDLFASNFYNGDVIRVQPDGEVSRFATLPGKNNGHLTYGNGVLYVAARKANQLYELTLDGKLTLLAGTGDRGLDDGPALEATLSLPNDVALSADGLLLYWNDVGLGVEEHAVISPTFVRKLTLPIRD